MNHNFLKTLSVIYYERLPIWIRKIIGPFVESSYSIISRLFTIACDLYLPVTLFKKNRNSHSSNPILFVAGKGKAYPILLNRIYNAEPIATRQRRMLIGKISAIDDNLKVDMVIIEADRCFSRVLSHRGFVAIPEWILFTLDLSIPIEEIFQNWKKRNRENFRKIRKYKYQYEIARDREQLHFFYHNMYLPYTVSRFGKLGLLASFGYMENLMQNGELLLVKQGNEYVSGGIISTATSPPIFAFLGVKDGNKDYVRQGAISALYYFLIVWAKERDYTMLDFGHCRPFFNDGVFQYKQRWGMRVHRSPRKHRVLYLSINSLNQHIKQFLINNPLVYEEQGQLKGLLYVQGNDPSSVQKNENHKRKYAIPGLKGFTIVPAENAVNAQTVNLRRHYE